MRAPDDITVERSRQTMCRHIRIAATAAIALSLLLAPSMALADDEKLTPPPLPTKPIFPTPNAAAPKPQPNEYEMFASEAFLSMRAAKDRCDPGSYAAARTRLTGAIAAMRDAAKKAKKLKEFSKLDPEELNNRADDYQTLLEMVDMGGWPCPSKPKGDQGYLPPSGGSKGNPPDWAIALAGQQASAIHDSFDSPGTGAFDGIAMVDRAMRAAHPNMSDRGYPGGCAEDRPDMRRIDPRYPAGFAPGMLSVARIPGFGGWGPGF
jgi:hypothetical protein